MLASRPIRRHKVRSLLTPTRITAAILFVLICFGVVLPGSTTGWLIGAYFTLVLVTALVVRGVRQEPGNWLGRRAVRRCVVVLLAAICVALVATPAPSSPSDSSGIFILFLLLIVFNIALGRATQRLATAPDAYVDERQEAQRNRAHLISYVILALVVGGTALVADTASAQTRSWLEASLGGGGWIAFLELLFVLPAMVMAFLEPGAVADEVDAARLRGAGRRGRLAGVLLALTLAVPVVLSLGVLVIPLRTSSYTTNPNSDTPGPPIPASAGGSMSCREFYAQISVGAGVTAVINLHAEACWDGTKASETYGMNASDCLPGGTVLAVVTPTQCQRTTSADGTLSFAYRSQVSSVLLPFLNRDVTLRLVMDRNGRVEQFP
ncbi:MAG: hypothetical protein ABI352_12370 [Candidatus Dormibacter sp.]